jgi:hypothetical protein
MNESYHLPLNVQEIICFLSFNEEGQVALIVEQDVTLCAPKHLDYVKDDDLDMPEEIAH